MGAVGALANFIERAGVATASISLIREQSEAVRPPRALWVPFALGRPLVAADAADGDVGRAGGAASRFASAAGEGRTPISVPAVISTSGKSRDSARANAVTSVNSIIPASARLNWSGFGF